VQSKYNGRLIAAHMLKLKGMNILRTDRHRKETHSLLTASW